MSPAGDGRSEARSLGLLVSVERGAAAMRRCMAAFSALLLIFGVGVLLTPHLDAANTTVLSSVPASSPAGRAMALMTNESSATLICGMNIVMS